MKTGTLYVVSTPIGNPEDLTLRALRVLRDVGLIAAEDPQATQTLLEPHQIATPLTTYHNLNKEEKTPLLMARLREGQSIALVSDAGTPVVQDPGRYLIAEAVAAGIMVSPIPGPSALLAALVGTGWSADQFALVAPCPARSASRRRHPADQAGLGLLVLFVEPRRLQATLSRLKKELGNRPAVLAMNLTTPTEQYVRGSLGHLIDRHRSQPFDGEMTLVIQAGQRTAGKNTSTRSAGKTRSRR